MFPDLRLLVVAVLAAIAGIGCGLGLFATFRVNHEPLMRFSEGGPPLQLAFDNRTALPEAASAIPARLPLDGGKVAPAPVLIPAPSVVEETPAEPAAPAAPQEETSEASGSADAPGETTIASATPADTSSPAVEDNKPTESEAEAVAMTAPSEAASNAAAASTVSEPVMQREASATDDQQPPAKPSTPPNTKQESKAVKTPAKPARTAAPVHRPAKVVRRRVPATAAVQPADQYAQPNYQQTAQTGYQAYQWTDPSAQARPTVRRVIVKKRQAVKRPAAATQSSLAGTAASVTGPE
jgi:hypothetical protein